LTGADQAREGPTSMRPAPRIRWLRARALPAFWVFLGLLAAGGWRIASIARASFAAYPRAATAAVVLFALYAVPVLLLLRAVGYCGRGSALTLATALGWGGLVATSAAIAGNAAVQDLLAKLASPETAATWGSAISGAGVEEIIKVLGVAAIALFVRPRFTGVVDGFVYGALVGLGFQVVENIVFALNAVAVAGEGDRVSPVVVTLLLRGFPGGLWSHTLFTGLAGAGVAYAMTRRDRPMAVRLLAGSAGVVAAAAIHFLWNSPPLVDGFGFGLPGALAALLVRAVPVALACLLLLRAAERRIAC